MFSAPKSLLAAAALLAGTTAAAQQPQTVKIGAALSMTGAAAAYGANQKNGILLAVEHINASKMLGNLKIEAVIEERDKGRAILLVSLEYDEVRALADRILVIYEGRIAGEFAPDATEEELATLQRLTERYCVVYQTLAAGPELSATLTVA